LPATSTMTKSTVTTEVGSCDKSCVDSMGSATCRQADVTWNMCSSGISYWTLRCQATCATCGGVLPPCGQCDHKCTNSRSESDCDARNRQSAGALCSGGWGTWWVNQCRAFCGACEGTLPPCSQTVQIQSYFNNVPDAQALIPPPPPPPPPVAPASTGFNPQDNSRTGQVMSSCFERIVTLLPLAVILGLYNQV
jgi:hypothetical protein